jgi:hypothetical protein
MIDPPVTGDDATVGTEVDVVDDVDPETATGGLPGAGAGRGTGVEVGVGGRSGKVKVSMTAPESSSSWSVALTS